MRPQLFFDVVALLLVAAPLAAQGTFVRMNQPETYIQSISADGNTVVGCRTNYGPAFRWTAAEGVVNIGGSGFQAKISRDGRTIVSGAMDSAGLHNAAIWKGGADWQLLGGVPGGHASDNNLSTAYGVSADGTVVVGLAWVTPAYAHGFRWDAKTGMVDLGSLQQKSSRASAISADGNVIVGWDQDPYAYTHDSWRGSMWWQGIERLMNPFGWIGQSDATNDCGSVIVGRGHPSNLMHAYRYTAWDAQIEDLGALPRGITPAQQREEDTSNAFAVSDDGNVVVGSSGWRPPLDAFIWTAETKMVKLSTYLADRGVTGFEKWRLIEATAITPDGKVIAGNGINPDGFGEGFIVNLR